MTKYKDRDIMEQGEYYTTHVQAMTAEGLHEKSAIAAELAHRDIEIDRLSRRLNTLVDLSGGRIVGPADLKPGPKEMASLVAAGALEVLARELDAAGQSYGAYKVRRMAATAKQWGASTGPVEV